MKVLSKREEIQKQALLKSKDVRRCSLAVSMGVGKTLIGLQHMDEQYKKGDKNFLVVAPKISIHDSWKEEAKKFNLEHLLPFITFTTYLSLNKHDLNYDVVYLDECHNLLYSHDFYLNFYSGKILGLTGTPPKYKNSEKGKMVDKYCPLAYEYITDDAIADGILNDYKIVVHKLKLSSKRDLKVDNKSKGSHFYTSEKDSYEYYTKIVQKEEEVNKAKFTLSSSSSMAKILRMKALMSFKTKEQYVLKLLSGLSKKCIIFCNTTEQADQLCSNSYHTKNKNSKENLEAFKKGEINCLSCVQQISEGVNIPELEYGIIMHSFSNERKSSQRIGRLLRLNPEKTAIVHMLMYEDTIDEVWVNKALETFDQTKITYVDAE